MAKRIFGLKKNVIKEDDLSYIQKIASDFDVEVFEPNLIERLSDGGMRSVNRFLINDDMIFFYPPNDGMPTCPFEFYKNGSRVLTNQSAFEEIANLDDIILSMVRIFDKALDDNIVFAPYSFLLKLDGVDDNEKLTGRLFIAEDTVWNNKLNSSNFETAKSHFINKFLDRFIGWNFGVSINRNDDLKEELEALNNKVIDMGIREYAGSGYEVFGSADEVYKGVQHYYLPIYKVKVKEKAKTGTVQV